MQNNAAGVNRDAPVSICFGGIYQLTEVNVVDRSGLKFLLLVGRQFLEQKFLVDPGARFINHAHGDLSTE